MRHGTWKRTQMGSAKGKSVPALFGLSSRCQGYSSRGSRGIVARAICFRAWEQGSGKLGVGKHLSRSVGRGQHSTRLLLIL